MSKEYYHNVKLIYFCKVCGVEFRPRRGSVAANLGLCYVCRHKEYKKYYRKRGKWCGRKYHKKHGKEYWSVIKQKWFVNKSSENKKKCLRNRYVSWLCWKAKALKKRRASALASYHRCKNKGYNKNRRHRATRVKT